MIKVAIVGSEGKMWTPNQRTKAIKKIKEILINKTPVKIDPTGYDGEYKDRTDITLVSGGCGGSTSENDKLKFNGGIDEWAEIIADILDIPKDIKYPEVNQFEDVPHIKQPKSGLNLGYNLFCPRCNALGIEDGKLGKDWCFDVAPAETYCKKGYKSRNIEVAKDCDVLFCLDPKGRVWSGGMWTLKYAQSLGKEVHHIIIE